MKVLQNFLLLLLGSLLVPLPAHGCSYPNPPEFKEVAADATSIFVMRVLDAQLLDSGDIRIRPSVRAEIKTIEELLGDASAFTHVTFDNLPCGGVRLDVGHYYLVFTSQTGETLRLVPADQSVLNITAEYVPGFDEQNHRRKIFATTFALIRGESSADMIDPYPYLGVTGVMRVINCKLCP